MNCFNPYSPGFSIYLILLCFKMYYINCFNPYSPGFSIYLLEIKTATCHSWKASILIHLDFLSIYIWRVSLQDYKECFNPYSPGFSIYFNLELTVDGVGVKLQSLFIWIFYLFISGEFHYKITKNASILIHLDFLSISTSSCVYELSC